MLLRRCYRSCIKLLGLNFRRDVRLLGFDFDNRLRLMLQLRLKLGLQLRLWFRWLLNMNVCLSLVTWSRHPRASCRRSNMDWCSWRGKRRFWGYLGRACSWQNRWLGILRKLSISGSRSSGQRLINKQLRGIHELML